MFGMTNFFESIWCDNLDFHWLYQFKSTNFDTKHLFKGSVTVWLVGIFTSLFEKKTIRFIHIKVSIYQ